MICYFNNGRRCLARLIISISSLRNHYDGPVCILDGDGQPEVPIIAEHFDAEFKAVELTQRRRHTAHSAKPTVISQSPYYRTIFLDSDTTIHGSLRQLISLASVGVTVVTRFGDWRTNGQMMSGRIAKWEGVTDPASEFSIPAACADLRTRPEPAINTGVVGIAKGECLERWERITKANPSFMADELAMQILVGLNAMDAAVVGDGWNYSPIYGKASKPIIVHYHGRKHLRDVAAPWFKPSLRAVWKADVCGIRSLVRDDPAMGKIDVSDYLGGKSAEQDHQRGGPGVA